MSRFRVDLSKPSPPNEAGNFENFTSFKPENKTNPAVKKSSGFAKFLKIFALAVLTILLIGAIGGFLYWRSVKTTPAYSLAMLVDAARRDDQAQMENYLDTDAVVENFMPQVTDKAIELYGRNLPQQTLAKVQLVASPLVPIIRERAKVELPRVVREKTAPVEKIPYWMIALFASRAVDISVEGDKATVKSKIPEQPLELAMKRDGDKWKVVSLKDEVLAKKIAEKIGQDIIAAASKGGLKRAAEQLGVKDSNIIQNVEDIFK